MIPTNALELAGYLVHHCEACPLSKTRTKAVPGSGPATAKIMLIAEGPGQDEDKQGLPFVGRAGKFLDELLPMAKLSRKNIFITNMIKCRAPDNRDPKPEELESCRRHLERQIIILEPKLIVTLGKFSMEYFLPEETISKARGRLRRRNGLFIYPVMHPAAGLRNGEFKTRIIEDFRKIPAALRQIDENPPEEDVVEVKKKPQKTEKKNEQVSLL